MITIDEIRVGDTADAWRAAGFSVDGDVCAIGGVRIRLAGEGTGITDWTLRGISGTTTDIDGIPTALSINAPGEPGQHPNGVTRIDHVVLMTPDLPRTTTALTTLGLDVRRERDTGAFQQVFFRLDDVILELVGPKEAGPGSAQLWGLTFVVEDIDATAALLGERVGNVKDAVQAGRRITTLRGRPIGISTAVAFITEHA
ncbi:MAG: VOC family protein [Aeromicrobium sp.]